MRSKMVMAAAAILVATPAHADVVTDWWHLSDQYYREGQGSGAPRNVNSERASARAALAMFEAINAIEPRYQSYLKIPVGPRSASREAAAVTAAHDVLLAHYPAHAADLRTSYVLAMENIPAGVSREEGVALGRRVAAVAITANGADPAVTETPYRPKTAPGAWIGASLPSLGPHFAAMKPWALASVDELNPPPPPALGSAIYARDYDEVRRLGGKTSKERSEWQTQIAFYRQGFDITPSVRWLTDRPGRDLLDNARLLALMQMAFDDAVQAMVVAKLRYEFWRPVTAIRNGDQDGNSATVPDPSWTPLLGTPNFQEYPCGHCTVVAANAEIMEKAGGWPKGEPVKVAAGGGTSIVEMEAVSWDELVRQVSDSRMYGGVHYRFSNDAGEVVGRKAARAVMSRLLLPLRR